MKTVAMMLKDLRLICRDRFGLIALLIVPIVVIMVVASATPKVITTSSINGGSETARPTARKYSATWKVNV